MAGIPADSTYWGRATERSAVVDLLGELGFSGQAARRTRILVLDTFDGRLAAAGLRLLHASPTGRPAALSLGGPGVVTSRVAIDRPPGTSADLPPGPLARRLEAVLVERTLIVQLDIAARAQTYRRVDRRGQTVAGAVLFDQLRLQPGPYATRRAIGTHADPAWALQLLAVTGHDQHRRRAASALARLGIESCPGDVVDLAAEISQVDLTGFDESPTIRLERTAPMIESTRQVLRHLTRAVDANWQGTIDAVDTEFLHDLRVAMRRTRSVLAETKQVMPTAFGAEARARVRDMARATSDARDLDVYGLEWPTYTAGLDDETTDALAPLVDLLDEHRADAYDRLRAVLEDDATAAWRERWQQWLTQPVIDADQGPAQHRPTGSYVAKRLDRAFRRLREDGRAIDETSPAERLHDLRKDAKRVRYLVECLGGVVEPEVRAPFVTRLKKLQAVLGVHQDAEVHIAHLGALSQELHARSAPPATLVAVGRLAEQLDQRRQAARDEFADTFARFDRPTTRRAVHAITDGARP